MRDDNGPPTEPMNLFFAYKTARWQLYYVAIITMLGALAIKNSVVILGIVILIAGLWYLQLRIPTIIFCLSSWIKILEYKRKYMKKDK